MKPGAVHTEWSGEGWKHAPHRVRCSSLEAAQLSGWRQTVPPAQGAERDVSDMAMYAGTGVGDLTMVESAAQSSATRSACSKADPGSLPIPAAVHIPATS